MREDEVEAGVLRGAGGRGFDGLMTHRHRPSVCRLHPGAGPTAAGNPPSRTQGWAQPRADEAFHLPGQGTDCHLPGQA